MEDDFLSQCAIRRVLCPQQHSAGTRSLTGWTVSFLGHLALPVIWCT